MDPCSLTPITKDKLVDESRYRPVRHFGTMCTTDKLLVTPMRVTVHCRDAEENFWVEELLLRFDRPEVGKAWEQGHGRRSTMRNFL